MSELLHALESSFERGPQSLKAPPTILPSVLTHPQKWIGTSCMVSLTRHTIEPILGRNDSSQRFTEIHRIQMVILSKLRTRVIKVMSLAAAFVCELIDGIFKYIFLIEKSDPVNCHGISTVSRDQADNKNTKAPHCWLFVSGIPCRSAPR